MAIGGTLVALGAGNYLLLLFPAISCEHQRETATPKHWKNNTTNEHQPFNHPFVLSRGVPQKTFLNTSV